MYYSIYSMKTTKWIGTALAFLALSVLGSCSREVFRGTPGDQPYGEVQISLAQDSRTTLVTKADGEEEALPPVDSFWIEIYNANRIRLYRQKYETAKSEIIKLNAGEFRLVASHGDTLGAGFGKAYYLADTPFTVHGFVENGREPDRVSATAKMANVKLGVTFGENLQKYYSNFYALVRHETHTKKSVRFNRNETRNGYIPGGNLYLEVFAQLAGTGMQDGGVRDSVVYFRSQAAQYDPNDFVTFHVECGEREGNLDVNILIDKEVEVVEQQVEIPSSALPKDAPVFTFRGVKGESFDYGFPIGVGASVADATMSYIAYSGVESATLSIDNTYLTGTLGLPAEVDLLNVDPSVRSALNAAGITWYAEAEAEYGFLNVSGVLPALSINSTYLAADPKVAAFTLTISDLYGKESSAVLNLNGEPIQAVVGILDYNIWGWKLVDPYADFSGVNNVNTAADIRLQYSLDGNTWQSVTKKSINGKRVVFNTPTGLTAGQTYHTRVMIGTSGDNYSAETLIKTEDPEQVPNNDFEQYSEQVHLCQRVGDVGTLIGIEDTQIKWWQLYSDGGTKSWAVNSPVSMRPSATALYDDYKCFPTVNVISDGAYDGKSIFIATVAEGNTASEWVNGDFHVGEVFIGMANNQPLGDWAKVSEGGTFSNRPSKLKFMYKLDVPGSGHAPYYVHVEILDADGNIIGQGTKNDVQSDVNSWTAATVAINYSITNRKAGGIKLSFMSSQNASDKPTSSDNTGVPPFGYNYRVDVNTLSGSHQIHAGNILYLDNVEMLYQ